MTFRSMKFCLRCRGGFETCFLPFPQLFIVRTMKMPSNAPSSVDSDSVGPPDKVSNIRPYKFYQPEDETEAEKRYREQRIEALEFNHEFWHQHNKSFFTQKEEFVKERLAAKKELSSTAGEGHLDDRYEKLSPEEMSEFYKKFLDDNYKQHVQYNNKLSEEKDPPLLDWYRKNISLLWPAAKVTVTRFFRKRRQTENG